MQRKGQGALMVSMGVSQFCGSRGDRFCELASEEQTWMDFLDFKGELHIASNV